MTVEFDIRLFKTAVILAQNANLAAFFVSADFQQNTERRFYRRLTGSVSVSM